MTWKELLNNPKIKDFISTAMKARNQAQQELGLNIFTLASDYYFRENFHSDIIKEFLDREGGHKEGNLYLDTFIEMLKTSKCNINCNFYKKAIVYRETYKIDILVEGADDNGMRHFIIIENKINDAIDMYRQIPRYIDKIEKEVGGLVDAVIYIPKNPYKSPDKTGWVEEEIKRINTILRIIPAHHTEKINLVSDWIVPCINASKHLDSISILRQYASLIKSLTPTIMSDNNMQEFIKYIAGDTDGQAKIEDILTLRHMIENIPAQMASDLVAEFTGRYEECKHFEIHQWQQNSCVLEIPLPNNRHFQIFIYTTISKENAFKLSIRDWQNTNQKFAWLDNIPYKFVEEKPKDGAICSCTFAFDKKLDVINCVEEIIKNMPA